MRRNILVGIFLVVLAVYYPILLYAPQQLALDDVGKLGSPNRHMPKNYRGVFYLSGNQEPEKCVKADLKNLTRCGPGGWKRSAAFLLDTSRCQFDGSAFVCSMAHAVGFTDPGFTSKMLIARPTYRIVKDSEFKGRHPDYFEGAMHLTLLGISANRWGRLFGGKNYRVTMNDNGDGASILRRTWWNIDDESDVPQPIKKADKEWTYTMKRLVDEHGRVDKRVLREMKRVYGNVAFFNQPRFW